MSAFPLLKKLAMSLSPLPPTPIPAMTRQSLGATKPLPPNTNRGTIKKPAVAREVFFKKSLLEFEEGCFFVSSDINRVYVINGCQTGNRNGLRYVVFTPGFSQQSCFTNSFSLIPSR